ncbi:MAG: hypothetical protein ABUL47_06265, partial [Leifsonia sp.]
MTGLPAARLAMTGLPAAGVPGDAGTVPQPGSSITFREVGLVTAATSQGARLPGIDVARGLALLGMFVAHAGPAVTGPDALVFLRHLPDERSRLLFAVAAGLGLGLLTGGTRPPSAADAGLRAVLRSQIAIRAVCLFVLGVGMQATGVLVYVILDEYGIAFAIMLPFLFLPARWLLVAGASLLA